MAAEADQRRNTSPKAQDSARQKEQSKQVSYRRMRQLFGRRWLGMDLKSLQPTHCLRKLSERIVAARRIPEDVSSFSGA